MNDKIVFSSNLTNENEKIAHKILKCAEKSVPLHTKRKIVQYLLQLTTIWKIVLMHV